MKTKSFIKRLYWVILTVIVLCLLFFYLFRVDKNNTDSPLVETELENVEEDLEQIKTKKAKAISDYKQSEKEEKQYLKELDDENNIHNTINDTLSKYKSLFNKSERK